MKFTALLLFLLCSFNSFTQTDSTAVLDFMVYDANTGEPLNDFRFIMSGTDGSAIDKIISDKSPNKFGLKVGYVYTITISANDFISLTDRVDTSNKCFEDGVGINIMKEYFLEPARCCSCQWYPPSVGFEFNSHIITESMIDSINFINELMLNNPNIVFELKGYISPEEHFSLGLKRATVVRNWLIENGAPKENLEIWWNAEDVKEMQKKSNLSEEEVKSLQAVFITIIKY